MKPGGLPTVVTRDGRTTQKPKLSLAARVANNSQKKIDTLTRIDDVTLKSMWRYYDLEMLIYESGHKKNSHLLQKQISSYQKSLQESRNLRQRAGSQTFMTQQSQSPDKLEIPATPKSAVEKAPRPKYGYYINCEPEAIGSVRRRTKSIQASSVSKSMTDLQKLREKHVMEYKQSLAELQQLQSKMDVPFTFNVPCRSYTPFTAPSPHSPIIISLRNKVKHCEKQLLLLQKKLHDQAIKYVKATPPATNEEEEEEEEEEEKVEKKEETFKIFCDRKLDERENTMLSSRPITTHLPQVNSRRNSRAVKFDLEKMKSTGSFSLPMLNLLAQNSKNSAIEIIDNPFDSGVIPAQTRSRLLIEAKKDDTMYQWLGFQSAKQLEAALKENPSSIRQIPAALLSLVEDEGEEEIANLDQEQFSDSDSGDEDDEDLRFKVFDKRKFKRRVSVKTAQA